MHQNITIIHGTKGSPEGNWFPWLAGELQKTGCIVHVPAFPTPENQSLTSWFKTFDHEKIELNQNSILIGHSIGAVFVARLIERSPKPIKAAFFISGLLGTIGIPEYDELNSTFFANPFNWKQIQVNCPVRFGYVGDDDPYVPKEISEKFYTALNISPTIIPKGGHLNSETGYTTFPTLSAHIIQTL